MITTEELRQLNGGFVNFDDATLQFRLIATEKLIRRITNNNFQVRKARFTAESVSGNLLLGKSEFIRVGDRVQITTTDINDNLYSVVSVTDTTEVNGELFAHSSNRVTKVHYSPDVIFGVVNMMLWDLIKRDKIGIKSEQISRHKITYADTDTNHIHGYPPSLVGFLQPYMRAQT